MLKCDLTILNEETMAKNHQERITIGVGDDMSERLLYFRTPPKVELMQPIVARLLKRDASFREVSEASPVLVDDKPSEDESFMRISTTDAGDWMSPPIINGNELENGAIKDKTSLSIEAARFALTALYSSQELND
jgi:hypothetical protein